MAIEEGKCYKREGRLCPPELLMRDPRFVKNVKRRLAHEAAIAATWELSEGCVPLI